MATFRVINPAANDSAIERIRVTFDGIVGGNTMEAVDLPEDRDILLGKQEGEFCYGISEDGVEGVAVLTPMGSTVVYRNGEIDYPDGEMPERFAGEDDYDYWYRQCADMFRTVDMPDKIEEPLEDEIDTEDFGDEDL